MRQFRAPIFILAIVVAYLAGCHSEPVKRSRGSAANKKDEGGDAKPQMVIEDGKSTVSGEKKAEKKKEPPKPDAEGYYLASDLEVSDEKLKVDFLIIKESSTAFNRAPFNNRIELGAESLATRLRYAKHLDYRVAAIDSGDFDSFQLSKARYITRESEDIDKLLKDRLSLNANATSLVPLTTLKNALDSDSKFFRKDAHLAVFFVMFSNEADETLTSKSMVSYLDRKVGKGKWSVSALVPDGNGCKVNDNINAEAERVNLILDLQQESQGHFSSLCNLSYNSAFDKLITQGGPVLSGLPHKLDKPIPGSDLKVTANGERIMGWHYVPDEKTVYLPRSLPVGSKVEVRYKKGEAPAGPLSSPAYDVDVPDLIPKSLSDEERFFVETIRPILTENCYICHMDWIKEYNLVLNRRTEIRERIAIPEDEEDPEILERRMPKNGSLAQEDLDTLLQWLQN